MGQSWLNLITVLVKDGVDSDQAEQQLTRLLTFTPAAKRLLPRIMDSVLKTAENHLYSFSYF